MCENSILPYEEKSPWTFFLKCSTSFYNQPNSNNIAEAIKYVSGQYLEADFDYFEWENSEYLPTPTIIEAAQALYRGHNVDDITRSDAGAENLTVTNKEINKNKISEEIFSLVARI